MPVTGNITMQCFQGVCVDERHQHTLDTGHWSLVTGNIVRAGEGLHRSLENIGTDGSGPMTRDTAVLGDVTVMSQGGSQSTLRCRAEGHRADPLLHAPTPAVRPAPPRGNLVSD